MVTMYQDQSSISTLNCRQQGHFFAQFDITEFGIIILFKLIISKLLFSIYLSDLTHLIFMILSKYHPRVCAQHKTRNVFKMTLQGVTK